MHLALDTGEQAIVEAAAGFLAGEFPLARLPQGHSDAGRLGEFVPLGWLGLCAPPGVGGSGLGPVEEMLFLLELGRVAGPLSVFAQLLAVHVAQSDATLCGALVRARAQLKASLMMALESCFAQSEDLARQLLIFGRRVPPEEIIAKIDAVDQEAIRRVGRRLLAGAGPTLAAIGPLARLPSLDSVRAQLR